MRLAVLFVLLTALAQAGVPDVWVDGPTKTIYYTPSTGLGVIYVPTTVAYNPGDSVEVVSGAPPPGVSWGSFGQCGPSVLCSAYMGVPSAAATGVYVQVLRARVGANTEDLTVEFRPDFSVSGTAAPAVVGASYETSFSLAGGVLPSAWDSPTGTVPPGLSFDGNTGRLAGTPTAAGDYTFTLAAHDSGSHSITKSVTLTVYGALAVEPASLAATTESRPYLQTLASTGGTTPKSWSIESGALPVGILMSSSTGALSGAATTPGLYSFTVRVECCSTASATAALSIVVNPAPSIQTSTLPGGVVGVAYPEQLSGSGGTGAVTWSLAGGTLPPGLSLSASGLISGTPLAMGPASFSAQLTDSVGAIATAALTIAVIDPPEVTPPTLAALTVGQTVQLGITATKGTAPYTWDLDEGALPAGVVLNPSTGALRGEPTQPGWFSFTWRVTDAQGQQGRLAQSWLVNAAPAIPAESIPATTISLPIAATMLSGTGGTGALAWSATGLPAGLILSTQGELSGRPVTEGISEVVFTVRDDNQVQASRTMTVTVNALPMIATSSLPLGVLSTAYQQVLAVTGGTGARTFVVTGGALPPGITLEADGTLSGAPTAKGSFSFTVKVDDALGACSSSAFTLQVVDTPEILTTMVPDWTAGQRVNLTLAAGRGTAPYRWALVGGTAPVGMQLDSDSGVISGTLGAADSGMMQVQVTDGHELRATVTLLWKVNPAPTLEVPVAPQLVAGRLARPWQVNFQGGTGTLSGYAEGLPSGLRLDAHSGLISGTPQVTGRYEVQFTLMDGNSMRASASASLWVYPGLSIETAALSPVTSGRYAARAIATSGGEAPFVWSIAGGKLPAGVIVRMADGTLEGTATSAEVAQFTLRVSDANGVEATRAYSLAVRDALSVLPLTLPVPQLGQTVARAVQAAGGTSPVVFSLASGSLPPGVTLAGDGHLSGTVTTSGVFSFSVKATDANGAESTRPFSLEVTAAERLKATPSTLSFAGYVGGAAPAPQQVALSSAPAGQKVIISSDSAWLSASLSTAVTPAVVNVSVAAGDLTPGDYTGAVVLRLGSETRSVGVTLHYATAPEVQLTASPEKMVVSAGTVEGVVERLLLLRTTSGTEPWAVSTDDAWLGVDRVSDAFDGSRESVVRVSLRRSHLRAGTYTGKLVFRQGSAVTEVMVRLELDEHSDFELSQTGLSLRAAPARTSAEVPFRILNHGAAALEWQARASAPWMVLEPAGGSAQPSSTVRVKADAANLAAGHYAGTVTVTPTAGGVERSAEVQLWVTPEEPGPQVSPAGLSFAGTAAATRTLVLSNPSRVEMGYTASIAPVEASGWLTLGSVSGRVPADGSLELTVHAVPGTAGEGTQRAQIALEFSDGTVAVVDVLLVIPATDCAATSLRANWVRLGDHFSVVAGTPAELEMLVTDNCGQPVSTGLGLVSFSSAGERALALVPGPDGLWTATWIPGAAEGSVTVTVRLQSGAGQTGALSATGVVTAPLE
ncbi:Ig domain-containing protein [Paludibaculum fermentans]|uniref:Ig domain-containing protein n=1 Tax=Paludibaculum fermentans TaxID=1473598 RepID=UPI003EB8ABB7